MKTLNQLKYSDRSNHVAHNANNHLTLARETKLIKNLFNHFLPDMQGQLLNLRFQNLFPTSHQSFLICSNYMICTLT